jgi:hypothetical protein
MDAVESDGLKDDLEYRSFAIPKQGRKLNLGPVSCCNWHLTSWMV